MNIVEIIFIILGLLLIFTPFTNLSAQDEEDDSVEEIFWGDEEEGEEGLDEEFDFSDDEEFFIPRWPYITWTKSFLLEARWYFEYFNNLRPHTWIWMSNMTPIEKIKSCWIYNADKLLNFPTMILEDNICEIMKCTDIIRLVSQVNSDRKSSKRWMWKYDEELYKFDFDQKYIMNMRANYLSVDFLKNAQNVFEQYHSSDRIYKA